METNYEKECQYEKEKKEDDESFSLEHGQARASQWLGCFVKLGRKSCGKELQDRNKRKKEKKEMEERMPMRKKMMRVVLIGARTSSRLPNGHLSHSSTPGELPSKIVKCYATCYG